MSARFGRYETLQPIASGGMATVHLARAVGAGGFERLVAIKVMHPGLSEDGEFSAMFLDEARVAARIRHPNVVGTLDVQEGDEGLFLVMEYVEGPSLGAITRTLGKKRQRMPVGVALRIVIDALLGLHAAHEQTGPDGEPLNIVHRDVSPQNILVSVDGQAKITDFGVARAESRLSSTRRGEVKGKLAYMSPQQVRTDPIDRRADVYAAGVVLWELLAGERLFTADNEGALVLSVIAGAKRSPIEVDPSVPAPLNRECMRALSADVGGRHATALELAEALELAAVEAGVAITTSRALAAFVKDLGAHKAIDVPPVAGGSGNRPRASVPDRREEAPAAAPAPMPAPIPLAAIEPDGGSQVGSVLSTARAPSATSSRTRLGVAAVAAIALLVGSGLLVAYLQGSAPSAAAPASAAVDLAAQPAPTASVAAPAPSAAPPAASATGAPIASASSSSPRTPATARAVTSPRKPPADWRPSGL